MFTKDFQFHFSFSHKKWNYIPFVFILNFLKRHVIFVLRYFCSKTKDTKPLFTFSPFIIFSKLYLQFTSLNVWFFLNYVINSPPRSTHILPGTNRKSYFKFLAYNSLVYTCKGIPSFSVDAWPIVLHSAFVQTTAFAFRLHLVLVLVEMLCEVRYFFNWPTGLEYLEVWFYFRRSTHLFVVKHSSNLPSKNISW